MIKTKISLSVILIFFTFSFVSAQITYNEMDAVVTVIEGGESVDLLVGNSSLPSVSSYYIYNDEIYIVFSDDFVTSWHIVLNTSGFGGQGGIDINRILSWDIPNAYTLKFKAIDPTTGLKGSLENIVFTFELKTPDL